MSEDKEDLRRFTTFVGTLSRDGISIPIRFQLRFATDGELRFRVYPVPMTNEAMQLLHSTREKSDAVPLYSVEATSKIGTVFTSDTIHLSKSGTHSTQTKAQVTFGFGYSRATFRRQLDEGPKAPAIRQWLRGFECFPQIRTNCRLGEVVMHGAYPAPKAVRVSGYLAMTAQILPDDLDEWRSEAELLFEHVRNLMGFALSHRVMAPIQDVWMRGAWERTAFSQTKSRRNAQHVIHPMLLRDYLDAIVAAYFSPPLPAKNLSYAVEWFAMSATYTEMRLTNVMTALENLIDSNLDEPEKFFLLEKDFKRLNRPLRHALRDELGRQCNADPNLNRGAVDELVATLSSKVLDLNRRPFAEKLALLAHRWNVPLADLPEKGIAKAVTARNSVVHRGYYYEPVAGTPAQRDLWDHVFLMREVAIRFVLTLVGFRGKYLSFRGGLHDVEFPPAPSS